MAAVRVRDARTRIKDGRLVHRVISVELARRVQRALVNYRQIRTLLAQWEQETIKELLDPDPGRDANRLLSQKK